MKRASLKELLTAVHAAVESSTGTQDENLVMVVPRGTFERAERAAEEGGLSARELEILLLVARGLSNRQIANSLTLAEATIKRRLANLYPKIGVGSRGEATRKVLAEGWISTRDVTEIEERLNDAGAERLSLQSWSRHIGYHCGCMVGDPRRSAWTVDRRLGEKGSGRESRECNGGPGCPANHYKGG